jgi:hypothetical protein
MVLAQLVGGVYLVTAYLTGVVAQVADGSAPQITWTMAVNGLVGIGLPILVALVTKSVHTAKTRSLLLLALSGVSGVLNEWLVSTGAFNWPKAVYDAVLIFVVGVATLYGLWKPTGVSDGAKARGVK